MIATVSTTTESVTEYNIHCVSCGQTFTPAFKSALWWKAKKREAEGFLDAHRCSGEECGCVQKIYRPDAPFRVFGYDGFGVNFNIPCKTMVDAVNAYRRHRHDTVFIKGVSEAVKQKLEDRNILEDLSDQNMLHVQQCDQLLYLLEWLFRNTDTLVDGTTKEQVDSMTSFKKIELLERLWEHPGMLGHEMLRDIGQFVDEIRPYKDGFRTADDFKRAS
jgi:hypothetical protein